MSLASIEKSFPVNGLNVDFSKGEASSQVNRLLNSNDVQSMWKGRDLDSSDGTYIVFPFICAVLNGDSGYMEDEKLTKFNSL